MGDAVHLPVAKMRGREDHAATAGPRCGNVLEPLDLDELQDFVARPALHPDHIEQDLAQMGIDASGRAQ